MKTVIMGCGRVGIELASMLDRQGHDVTVLDIDPDAFDQLPAAFGGTCVVGNGIDQDVLERIGLSEVDAFVAVTPGDNRNAMASQMAKHIFGVPKVVARIFDPIRQEMYRNLGLDTISPTKVVAQLLWEALDKEPAGSPADGQTAARMGDPGSAPQTGPVGPSEAGKG